MKIWYISGNLSGWISNIENIKVNNLNQTDSRFKGGCRKLDSKEFDKAIINFKKEAEAHEIAITSSVVIYKAIELIPGFKDKSYDSLYHWFKRFREKVKNSLRKGRKISQSLPENYLDEIRLHLYENLKDMINMILKKIVIWLIMSKKPL